MLFPDLAEHLPDHTLEAFLRAWPAEPTAHPRLVHLAFCERCRRRCEELAPEKAKVFLRAMSDVFVSEDQLDRDSIRRLTELIHRHEVECDRAAHVAGQLLELEPGEQRKAFVHSIDPPISPVALANGIRLLLPDLVHHRPEDIEDLAVLGVELLNSTDGSRLPRTFLDIAADLEAQAGNACRLLADPRGARKHLNQAFGLAAESPDDLLRARVAVLTGVYLRDARRFETAEKLASYALAVYQEVEDHHEAGRVEFLQATVSYFQADFETAAKKLLLLRTKDLDPITRLSTTFTLAHAYVLLERSFEAVKLLPEVREVSQSFTSPSIQVYIDWLKGLILGHAGQTAPAERLFSKVERFFLERGQLTETALAVLDLADIYHKVGRHQKAAEAARSVIGAFEVTEKHQEALAALRLYVEAEESAKREIGRELRLFLPLANSDPSFEYRPGCMIG